MDTTKQKKHRAPEACVHCRHRKVRCDVVYRQPCTNCRIDGKICLTRRKRRPVHKSPPRNDSEAYRSLVSDKSPDRPDQAESQPDPSPDLAPPQSPRQASQWPSEILYSAYGFIVVTGLHQLSQEDVQFLSLKSSLLLPTQCHLDEFLKHFFLFIHPGLPVFNESEFWSLYHDRGDGERGEPRSSISLFVMQAILWVSCAFMPLQTIENAGYRSIQQARGVFYQRAKLLYDLDAECDHFSLAVGALLLTYRFDQEDRQAASVWLSKAIYHSRAIRAHQFATVYSRSISRNMLKRLWWCICLRDRILPMALHRPMQIDPSEISPDMEQLTEEDLLDKQVGSMSTSVYSSETKSRLCRVFIRQCRLVAIMGNIINFVRDQKKHALSNSLSKNAAGIKSHYEVTALRQQLTGWFHLSRGIFGDAPGVGQDRFVILLFSNITLMYYHASQMYLANHELYLIESGISALDYTYEESLKSIMLELREACLSMGQIAMFFVTEGIVKHLPVTTLAYLAPSLILKILDKTSKALSPGMQGSESGEAIYCAQVVQHCDSQYEGVEDLTRFIKIALSTVSVADVLTASQEPSLGSLTSPIGWERLVLTKPRLYLRMIMCLSQALSCGELSGKSQRSLDLHELDCNEPRDTLAARRACIARTTSSAEETCGSITESDSVIDHHAESAAVTSRSTFTSLDAWTLDEIGFGDEFQESYVLNNDPQVSRPLNPVYENSVYDGMSLNAEPCSDTTDNSSVSAWREGSYDWLIDLYSDITKVA